MISKPPWGHSVYIMTKNLSFKGNKLVLHPDFLKIVDTKIPLTVVTYHTLYRLSV